MNRHAIKEIMSIVEQIELIEVASWNVQDAINDLNDPRGWQFHSDARVKWGGTPGDDMYTFHVAKDEDYYGIVPVHPDDDVELYFRTSGPKPKLVASWPQTQRRDAVDFYKKLFAKTASAHYKKMFGF